MKHKPSLFKRLMRLQDRFGSLWPLIISQVTVLFIFMLGTWGYMEVEGWTMWDSFYMVVITLATVGYGEVHPLSEQGRILTTLLIFAGVGNFAFILGAFSQLLVDGNIHKFLRRRRVLKKIDRMKGHTVVCGYGRIGSVVVDEFLNAGIEVVVIEQNPKLVEELEIEGIPHLYGDATDDAILSQAGLARAKSLVAALASDADNVYIALSANQINPDMNIIARASSPCHVSKLKLAGADRVFLPHHAGGLHMANAIIRPTVTSVIELVNSRSEMTFQIEEWTVRDESELVGKKLMDSGIRQRFDLIVLSIKKYDSTILMNPSPESVIDAGDTIIAVGFPDGFRRFEEIV